MIDVLALSIVVDSSSPLVDFILFSICDSLGNERRQPIKGHSRLNPLADIEGSPGIDVSLSVFFHLSLLGFLIGIDSLVKLRAEDQVMEDAAVLDPFLMRFGLWLCIELREEGLAEAHL